MTRGTYALKPAFVRSLRGVEDRLVARRVSADSLSAGAVVVSAAAGAAIAAGAVAERPLWWLGAAPLLVARLAFNALDGSVARRTGTARPGGAVVNEVADRLGDAAMIAPLAVTAPPALVLGALLGMVVVSLTGVLSLAITGRRDTGGPMGKSDRVLLMVVASLVAAGSGSSDPFAFALWTILVGAIPTASARLVRTVRAAR